MHRKAILILIAGSLLCGCRVAELGGVDGHNYYVIEDGHERRFHVIQVWTSRMPPIGPQTARRYVLLVDRTP